MLIAKSDDVVGLNKGREDWEAMLHISAILETVLEDTGDLDLVTRTSRVDQIVEDVDLLLAGNTTRRYGAGSLLDGPLLIVAIHRLAVLDFPLTLSLADDALTEGHLRVIKLILINRSALIQANSALVVHLLELGEDG